MLLVSDIATTKGNYIASLMFSGETKPAVNKHKVNQNRPSAKAWRQLRWLLLMLNRNSPCLQICKPLGPWLMPWDEMWCQWQFFYDASSGQQYHLTQQGYTQHEKRHQDYNKHKH